MENAAKNQPQRHICIGIMAHVDAGKTTLSEALLYGSGALRHLGRVDHGDSFLDTDAQERARGITIFSKQALLQWEDLSITLLSVLGDFSPTHLTRIESGERLMDSIESLILFCDACHVPIDKYLVLCGMQRPEKDTPTRRAFPAIETGEQENAINTFAKMITSKKLTTEDITQILTTAIAYADFCDKKNG